ncbi:hypothetical protein OZN62_08385 [Aurantiacibacter sp. MUD11]|uniref:hypothetical protein n=1 Tax=Aurantiacibacter sp. MUD11 TaxID=3003265 RepID=UPI0022AAF394|nr:hypothetical protein [Aurantiacibacter sp. MUD11]WAT16957.1 hypothetical protein OZN62_08385 [Aurantiacibacter sp. MUD11]
MSRLDHSFAGNESVANGGDVELRTTPSAFLRQIFDELGQPEWMTAGTLLVGEGEWPQRITVRDHLVMTGNLVLYGPDPAYHIEFCKAGVPLYYGALETAMRYAPTIAEAYAVIADYASERPGWVRFEARERDDWYELMISPGTHLGGRAQPDH